MRLEEVLHKYAVQLQADDRPPHTIHQYSRHIGGAETRAVLGEGSAGSLEGYDLRSRGEMKRKRAGPLGSSGRPSRASCVLPRRVLPGNSGAGKARSPEGTGLQLGPVDRTTT